MKQSVDLFPAHLRHDPVFLGALQALYATGALLVLLVFGFVVLDFLSGRDRASLETLRADVESQRTALRELERTHPAIAVDEALAAETQKLESERAAKASVLALISQGALGNQSGFSPLFEALARYRVPGVWLDRVVVAAGGRDVSLFGGAVEGTRVPQLLRALGDSEPFHNRSFRTLRMEQQEEGGGHVQFSLSARPEGEDVDGAGAGPP